MFQQKCERRERSKFLTKIFQTLFVLTILNAKLPSISALGVNAATSASSSAANEEKRNWQSLQGPWGKRAHYAGPMLPQTVEQEYEDQLVPLLISNGERDEPFHKYSMMYLTNAGTLDRLLQEKQEEQNGLKWNDDLITSMEDNDSTDENMLLNEKRAWNKINTLWGKRRNAPTWNKFRGAWGKREPGWNNLKGMWGKRSSKDWTKLQGGWGKRSLN
ncbi:allatostatins MIP [Eurosta solidaginis]|uniref:allatostatins MIP n=1 Tax=Eurosta solidaginis TaxID=178769 RepID=UPI0035314A6A